MKQIEPFTAIRESYTQVLQEQYKREQNILIRYALIAIPVGVLLIQLMK